MSKEPQTQYSEQPVPGAQEEAAVPLTLMTAVTRFKGVEMPGQRFEIDKTASPKASGNRCIVFLDTARHRQDVLLVYGKTDLPKNIGETQYIYKTVEEQFNELWGRLG